MTTQNHSEWPPERIAEVLEYEAKATPGPWLREGSLIYTLMHAGWRKGVEQFKNSFSIRVERDRETPESEMEATIALIMAARTDLPSAVREIQRLRGLFQQIMIGGNHLATHLIGSSSKLPNDFKSYEEARDEEGMAYADCWVAWRKIMDARDVLDAAKDPAK